MKSESLCIYIIYNRREKGTVLMDLKKNPVKDVDGNLIKCLGGWKNPRCIDNLCSAVSAVHIAHGLVGQYQDTCDACLSLPDDKRREGCWHHPNNAAVKRIGDATKSGEFKNCIKQSDKDGKGYETNGSCQLTPAEVRAIFRHLTSADDIESFQYYVMLIVSIQLFLRFNEYGYMQYEHFLPEMSVITDQALDALTVQVQGKTDNLWVKMHLWGYDEYPELDALRWLLIWVWLIDVEGGFLFPTAAELVNPPEDGIYKDPVNYDKFLERLKLIMEKVIPRRCYKKMTRIRT